jgi:hypothetical protein
MYESTGSSHQQQAHRRDVLRAPTDPVYTARRWSAGQAVVGMYVRSRVAHPWRSVERSRHRSKRGPGPNYIYPRGSSPWSASATRLSPAATAGRPLCGPRVSRNSIRAAALRTNRFAAAIAGIARSKNAAGWWVRPVGTRRVTEADEALSVRGRCSRRYATNVGKTPRSRSNRRVESRSTARNASSDGGATGRLEVVF